MYLYILKCSDNSYYTGVTGDIEKRINEHNIGIDPKSYTFNRKPVKCVFVQQFNDPLDAIKSEKRIKGWSRPKKEALILGDYNELIKLSNQKNNMKNKSD
ncbi:MAG: GIY-YIG nuclease family protein [Candidatus Delongbacteria bacterium]|jgi:putative endonuclease|nr:GIY-YIG nuclease family protein [Candidatus Delongbacteria bacterium]